jgi:hypothetical protein
MSGNGFTQHRGMWSITAVVSLVGGKALLLVTLTDQVSVPLGDNGLITSVKWI